MKLSLLVMALTSIAASVSYARPNIDLHCKGFGVSVTISEVRSKHQNLNGLIVALETAGNAAESTFQPRFLELDPNSDQKNASYSTRDHLYSETKVVTGAKVISVNIDSNSQSWTSVASDFLVKVNVAGEFGGRYLAFSRESCEGVVPSQLL